MTNTADNFICKTLENIGKEGAADTLKKAAKASNCSVVGTIASKAVNPLLVGAAGIRVLKDDDQYSALIEETSAMGMMFGYRKTNENQQKRLSLTLQKTAQKK